MASKEWEGRGEQGRYQGRTGQVDKAGSGQQDPSDRGAGARSSSRTGQGGGNGKIIRAPC